jgi:hypothetical protein
LDYSQIEKRLTGALFTESSQPVIVLTEGTTVTGRFLREPYFPSAAARPVEVSSEVQRAIMSVVLGTEYSQMFAERAALKQKRFNLLYGTESKASFERFARYNAADLIEYPSFDSNGSPREAIAKILH